MGKYDPLAAYLRRQRQSEIRLTFADIERIVGRMLPKAARASDWWTGKVDGGAPAPQQDAWAADFSAVPDLKGECVLFVRNA